MNKTAFIFPGQGSQNQGMGHDIYMADEEAKSFFIKAEEIVKRPLRHFIFGERSDQLHLTINTQPTVFLVDFIYYDYLKKNGLEPFAVAGHSLGELVALVASDVIDFETGIFLIGKRADLMHEAAMKNPGSMLAVIGLDQSQVDKVCDEIDHLEVANYNSPGQVVVSGTSEAIESSENRFKDMGAKMVVKLAVSGGFHSSLMKEAEKKFLKILNQVEFKRPSRILVQNLTGSAETEPEIIKDNLARQISSPVKWVSCIQYMTNKLGIESLLEIGPSNVLTKLAKRINKDVEIYNANSLQSSKDILRKFGAGGNYA